MSDGYIIRRGILDITYPCGLHYKIDTEGRQLAGRVQAGAIIEPQQHRGRYGELVLICVIRVLGAGHFSAVNGIPRIFLPKGPCRGFGVRIDLCIRSPVFNAHRVGIGSIAVIAVRAIAACGALPVA